MQLVTDSMPAGIILGCVWYRILYPKNLNESQMIQGRKQTVILLFGTPDRIVKHKHKLIQAPLTHTHLESTEICQN